MEIQRFQVFRPLNVITLRFRPEAFSPDVRAAPVPRRLGRDYREDEGFGMISFIKFVIIET
jgi:hypothetical protein